MGWRNLVKPLSTAEVAGNIVSQKFRHPTLSMVVSGVHVAAAFFNDPAFADIKMRIYSDRSGSPGKLMAESTTLYTKAQCLETYDHGLKFMGFAFPETQLLVNEWYHLVMVPSSYTGVDSSFIAWRFSYPDPQYPIVSQDVAHATEHHLEFNLIGYTIGAGQ